MNELIGSATYSPEDNKLRLYPTARLPADLYQRVKAAGFIWAAKQELFVAPMWTPEREDLLLELCGGVDDEDKSLAERAEERSERFGEYSEHRQSDGDRAHAAVEAICEHIPLGQPILVGHHSERGAKADQRRIHNGMDRACRNWDAAKYWKRRAAAAIGAAQYKERPDVRARRISKLEAEKRKGERNLAKAERGMRFWEGQFRMRNTKTGESVLLAITEENRALICYALGHDADLGYMPIEKHPDLDQFWHAWDVLLPDGERYERCPAYPVAKCQEIARKHYPEMAAYWKRWIAHYENRISYEREMLAGQLAQAQALAPAREEVTPMR